MRIKTIMLGLLCTAVTLSIFTGCGKKTVSPIVSAKPGTSEAAPVTDGSAPSGDTLDRAGAYASLEPDTVMITIDENSVTWDELFYLINYSVSSILAQGIEITDWSAEYSDGITYEDFVLDTAISYVLQDAVIDYGTRQLGVALSDEAQAEIQSDWNAQVKATGSEESFIAQLEAQYCTKEIYLNLVRLSLLARECFAELYGEEGDKLTDGDVAEITADDGYLMAKHILFKTVVSDESGNEIPMTESDKAAVRKKADAILNELKSYEGKDFDMLFDELMNANSEDIGGLAGFPQGYLFQSGNMVIEFEEATKALEVGQISDLVETDFGYHIIYRIPVNCDITPIAYNNYGMYSLRHITALKMFEAKCDSWLNSLDISNSDEYNALDFNRLFTRLFTEG